MKIKGLEGYSGSSLQNEVNNGGRFVVYHYTLSIGLMTFKKSSHIYFLPNGVNKTSKGLKWSGITLLFGWWGLPWGPINTIESLVTNFGGGENVTDQTLKMIYSNSHQHVFDFEINTELSLQKSLA